MTEKISRKGFLKAAGVSLVVAPMALGGLEKGQKSPAQNITISDESSSMSTH